MWLVILAIIVTVAVLLWCTHEEEAQARKKKRHWANTDFFDFPDF